MSDSVHSFLNITTDKVYKNREWEWAYRENEVLDGFDPYSNSKSCSELITATYERCFLDKIAISTARAGNVIGGGDFSSDRIIPDCIRAAETGAKILVRNPRSIRPYQHVLEAINAYMEIAEMQYNNKHCAGNYNVGPDERGCCKTSDVVKLFCDIWGEGLEWESICNRGEPHEANFLRLDCSHIKYNLGWKPKWDITTAIVKTIDWTKCWQGGGDIRRCMDSQIDDYISCDKDFVILRREDKK